MRIKGITVSLQVRTVAGKDALNHEYYSTDWVDVENVLVSPVSAEDQITSVQLHGKKAIYQIAIPKGDEHIWDDRLVRFFGQTWHVFGAPETGIEENIPLSWNTKWKVEAYE